MFVSFFVFMRILFMGVDVGVMVIGRVVVNCILIFVADFIMCMPLMLIGMLAC
jgi:hypothetical protein